MSVSRGLATFARCRSGVMFVKFALMLPVLLALTLGGMDYAWTLTHKSVMQDAADIAAIAGAKELSLSDAKRENVEAVVKAMVERYIEENRKHLLKKDVIPPKVEAVVTQNPLQVEVKILQPIDPLVGGQLGIDFPALNVRSVARVIGQPNICVLALDPSVNGAISLEHKARVTGKNCAVYSNSSHRLAIKSKNSASLTASFICSRGGKSGGPGNFNPAPMVDCPGFDDPLEGRAEPAVGACMETDLVIDGGVRALAPGTYCRGVHATNGAIVTLLPGVHIFKDGPFRLDKNASLTGVNVSLYFVGSGAEMQFENQSTVSLVAPVVGELAGLLVFESRKQPESAQHRLFSNNAPLLLGTIYIPRGELRVDADAPIAHESAFTAIVARAMRLYGGPHLVLNTDYDRTDVPVPKGIRGAGQPVRLVQ